MAAHVMRRLFLPLLLCGLAGPAAAADAMPDPTRPGIADAAPGAAEASSPEPAAAGLQTIVRRKGRAPAAVINGELVKLGAKSGDSTLVKVGDDYVVLKGPAGRQVLRLTPDIKKKLLPRAKAAPAIREKAKE